MRHQTRRYEKQIAELQFPTPAQSTPDKKKQKLLVSKALWNSLSPHTKTKSKHFLSDSNSGGGLNTLFRKELGVNLSNSRSFTETETPLVKVINEFIERDDVSRVSPFVCVFYDEGRYWGRLMKVFSEDKETKANLIEVSFLENRCEVWDFPKNTKTLLIETKYVFMGPCKPKNITKKGYAFDDEKAQDIYRYIKSKKL